jgi:ADP-heptose:LPS heptosyltransferase
MFTKPSQNQHRVGCILPNRIGDCLFSLPAVATLSLLFPNRIELLVSPFLMPLLKTLPFPWILKPLTWQSKLASCFKPYDYLVHLITSNLSLGLRSHLHAGYPISQKSWIRFDETLPFLDVHQCKSALSASFQETLLREAQMSYSVIRNMGLGPICFEQPEFLWIQTYLQDVKPKLFIQLPKDLATQLPAFLQVYTTGKQKYITLCMEAAYGSKRNENRRWSPANWHEFLSTFLSDSHLTDYHIVILGSSEEPLPVKDSRIVDARKQISLLAVAFVIQYSSLYVGNDSGLLHLATFTQTPSIGLYHVTDALHYGPVHQDHFKSFEPPYSVQEVAASCKEKLAL